jgi:hypothetical protein
MWKPTYLAILVFVLSASCNSSNPQASSSPSSPIINSPPKLPSPVVSSSASPSSSNNPPAGLIPFPTAQGYTVSYPSGWQAKTGIGSSNVGFLKEDAQGGFKPNVTVEILPQLVKGGNSNEAPQLVENLLKESVQPQDQVLGAGDLVVADLPAKTLKVQRKYPNLNIELIQTFTVVMNIPKNQGYLFITSNLPAQEDEFRPQFDRILQSLREP